MSGSGRSGMHNGHSKSGVWLCLCIASDAAHDRRRCFPPAAHITVCRHFIYSSFPRTLCCSARCAKVEWSRRQGGRETRRCAVHLKDWLGRWSGVRREADQEGVLPPTHTSRCPRAIAALFCRLHTAFCRDETTEYYRIWQDRSMEWHPAQLIGEAATWEHRASGCG